MAFEPFMLLKSLCIILLANYLCLKLPTNFSDEAEMQTNLTVILAEASTTELWTRWERPTYLHVIYGVILLCANFAKAPQALLT